MADAEAVQSALELGKSIGVSGFARFVAEEAQPAAMSQIIFRWDRLCREQAWVGQAWVEQAWVEQAWVGRWCQRRE